MKMPMRPAPANAGFTLIEMLVVVAIIAVLASLVLTSVSGARIKARDAARRATLDQLRTALELYYNDFGAYPTTGGVWKSSECPGDPNYCSDPNFINGLVPNYIQRKPRDPLGGLSACVPTGPWRAYLYYSNGTMYKLLSYCAPEGTLSATDPMYDPVRPAAAWMVCSGATACTTW